MPDVRNSFYQDMVYGENYFTYLTKELPEYIQTIFPVSKKREDTFVAGLSMGGYGAMKLALTYPERFGAAASFSGVVDIARMRGRDAERVITADNVFGENAQIAGTDADLFHLLEKNAKAAHKPKLYVSCGTEY